MENLGLDLNKVKVLQQKLVGGPALDALMIAVREYLESDGNNFSAMATLQKAGLLQYPDPIPEIPSNANLTADGVTIQQLNS